jgi:hypothetical protein
MAQQYEKEMYVNVLDIKFYVCDEDGNEILDENGFVKEFQFEGRLKALEYLCEDMTIDDLTEIKQEINNES